MNCCVYPELIEQGQYEDEDGVIWIQAICATCGEYVEYPAFMENEDE